MTEKTIPLVGNFTSRPGITYVSTDKDQKLKGCYIDISADSIAKESAAFLCKRPAWALVEEIVSGKSARALYAASTASDDLVAIFSDGTVYHKSVAWVPSNATGNSVVVSGTNAFITDGVINGVNNFFISTIGTNGTFILPADAALDSTPTFTADTANGSPTLSNVSSFSTLYVGQALSGTGIAAGARIQALNSGASTITMTANATATGTGVTITFTPLAKIIDADFTYDTRGAFAFMDGYLFIMDASGKIYNSEINNPQSWLTSNFITGTRVGNGVGVVRRKNTIVGFFSSYHEVYQNAGNSFGSPLILDKGRTSDIGAASSQILSYAERIFWIGTTGGQQYFEIYMMSDEGVRKISSPQISRILSQLSSTSIVLAGGNFGGYDWVTFQSSDATYSFMYCIQLDRWFETAFSDCYVIAGSKRPAQGLYGVAFDDSDLLRFNAATFRDNSVAFSTVIQTQPHYLNGGKGFYVNSVELIGDTQASGSSTLETSADDYASFKTCGSFDLTSQMKIVRRCGYYRSNVAFRVTDGGNQAWRAQALKVDWTPAAA